MPTRNPTKYVWLLTCSSTRDPGFVVLVPLRTPSSRTKRYSRIVTDADIIHYGGETFMSDLDYKQIYLKKAIKDSPNPRSRICHLRSYPSHLLKPVEGLDVDLDESVDGHLLWSQNDVVEKRRQWDPDSWTADLGTSHLKNGIGLTFSFAPSFDRSKYVIVTMGTPGPSKVALTRYRMVDSKPSLEHILEDNLKQDIENDEWIYIPETDRIVSLKVDVEVEHGGIV
jgi:hypothetical protein